MISVVIPTLNEAAALPLLLTAIQPLRANGGEVIVVDGGSVDTTVEKAKLLADQVLVVTRGRTKQMNYGAAIATGELIWFLHADTVPPTAALELIQNHSEALGWGRFDVRLSGESFWLRIVERFMNMRSRFTGIATGDQGIFISRELFECVGGFPDQPLMEDIEISRRLKRLAAPHCFEVQVTTSSRRWEESGIWRTIFKMWGLRLAYFFGASPEHLASRYYGK